MGTRKEAHKYLLEFRKAILKDPTSFQEKSEILRKNLDELETRYRDRNWFATGWDEGRKSAIYKGENKLKLDSKETGIIELLQTVISEQRETIKTWRASLEERTKKLFKSNIEIKKLYESSSDYFRLKNNQLKNRSRKKLSSVLKLLIMILQCLMKIFMIGKNLAKFFLAKKMIRLLAPLICLLLGGQIKIL